MLLTIFLFAFLAEAANCNWDVAVLTSSHLELLNESLSDFKSIKFGIPGVTNVVYDPFNRHVYFSGNSLNASIFRKKIFQDGSTGPLEPLVKEQSAPVKNLAYDAKTNTVFWSIERQIFSSQLDQVTYGLSDGKVIHSVECGHGYCDVHSLAIDSCSRHIYWSYSIYIKRMSIDGTTPEETIYKEKDYFVDKISISMSEEMIYWWDHSAHGFRIRRGRIDGSMSETLFNSTGYEYNFISLATSSTPAGNELFLTGFSKEDFYSKEVYKLWIFKKDSGSPKQVFTYEDAIFDVIVSDGYKEIDNSTCSHLISMRDKAAAPEICVRGTTFSPGSCTCPPGYFGNQCEKSVCYNYCLEGNCTVDDGKPTCDCPPGRLGERCEHSCLGYCYRGECVLSSEGKLSCNCSNGWHGERCDKSKEFCTLACTAGLQEQHGCNCNSLGSSAALTNTGENPFKLPFFALIGVCGVLTLSVLVISILLCRQRRRPRMKRLYKVTPQKPAAPEQARTSPDCEIAIENCCNMNICETPCYEPELRSVKGKTKKEEHKSLLNEMEVQPGAGLTF